MIDLRKGIFSMLGRKSNLKKNEIVKHFMEEGFKKSTIYSIIKRYEVDLSVEDRPRSGRSTHFDKKNLKTNSQKIVKRYWNFLSPIEQMFIIKCLL